MQTLTELRKILGILSVSMTAVYMWNKHAILCYIVVLSNVSGLIIQDNTDPFECTWKHIPRV